MTTSERMRMHHPAAFPALECIIGPPVPYTSMPHLHEELEIAWNGTCGWHEVCRGQTYHVAKDALLLTPPEMVHTAFSPEAGEKPYFGMRIAPAFLIDSLSAMTERPQAFPLLPEVMLADPSFTAHFLALHVALCEKGRSRLEQDALWQTFVAHVHRLSTNRAPLPPLRREPEAVRVVKAYLHAHHQENVSLSLLAQLVGQSVFSLTRSFHAALGLPPHAYQTQLRILYAKRLLRRGQPPGEVALATGFHQQSHFGRHFTRLVGMPPGQYAQACQQR